MTECQCRGGVQAARSVYYCVGQIGSLFHSSEMSLKSQLSDSAACLMPLDEFRSAFLHFCCKDAAQQVLKCVLSVCLCAS